MYAITAVTLGPGAREYITLGAIQALEKAERVVLRTFRHDAADYLREKGIPFDTLDALHDASGDFDAFSEAAADAVIENAKHGTVAYGVLDASADNTVRALTRKGGENVSVLGGVSVASPILSAAKACYPARICDASSLLVWDTQDPLILIELNSRALAGDCKLKLLSFYGAEEEVLFFPPSKAAERRYLRIPLFEMDRQPGYDHTAAVFIPSLPLEKKERYGFSDLVRIMRILRGENGCPWDREQTHESLRPYLIEEAYETSLAIGEGDFAHVADELGDVLLQVVFQADIGVQFGTFELSDVCTAVCKKMIERHRHIFGGVRCDTAEEVSLSWERIKSEQRGLNTRSDSMRSVPRGLPSLMRAVKVQGKAQLAGLFAKDPQSAFLRVSQAAETARKAVCPKDCTEALGELLFRCADAARQCGLSAESVLSDAVESFINRFEKMEKAIISEGKLLESLTLSEMDVYWNRCKQRP